MKNNLPTAPHRATQLAPGTRHEVRIIAGQFKRTTLTVANQAGLRPTPNRVRETLFNWLGKDLSGWRCLDVFAGTGALGFEAASRGAQTVQINELDARLIVLLRNTQDKLKALGVSVTQGDGVAALRRARPASLDLVLLDPPFDSALFVPALQAARQAVTATGWIYLEAPRYWNNALLESAKLQLYRHVKAGAVHAHLLKRTDSGVLSDRQPDAK